MKQYFTGFFTAVCLTTSLCSHTYIILSTLMGCMDLLLDPGKSTGEFKLIRAI